MLSFLTNWAINKANSIMDSRDPDFVIGPRDDPYMLRWWAIPRNKFFNIYLHKILHDDDDRALHDHPWPSLSLMCSGTIKETYITGEVDDFGQHNYKTKILKAGDWRYRGPTFAHRLELVRNDISRTIFMTGPRIREWGFLCPKGWRHWKDFVNQENKGEQGVGCGEVSEFDEHGIFNDFHCRECGGGEILMYNYDGYCRNCVEFSPHKRGSLNWTVGLWWLTGLGLSMFFWTALITWCLS